MMVELGRQIRLACRYFPAQTHIMVTMQTLTMTSHTLRHSRDSSSRESIKGSLEESLVE